MTTLVLSTWSLPASKALAAAAQQQHWRAHAFDEQPDMNPRGRVVLYAGTDRALAIAARFHLALLEPPFDLLSRLPLEFRLRLVEYSRFGDLGRLKTRTFVKPADALNKSFDAGIYGSARDIRLAQAVDPDSPVLLAEPVEWSAEYRCFIREGVITAWSPYISFGRPAWKPFAEGTLAPQVPENLQAFCERLFSRSGVTFPPAFVMDIGLIDDRGWGVVEFNPAWCSGVLGADPRKVLAVLERACQDRQRLSMADRRWLVDRRQQVVWKPRPGGCVRK